MNEVSWKLAGYGSPRYPNEFQERVSIVRNTLSPELELVRPPHNASSFAYGERPPCQWMPERLVPRRYTRRTKDVEPSLSSFFRRPTTVVNIGPKYTVRKLHETYRRFDYEVQRALTLVRVIDQEPPHRLRSNL